MNRTLLWHITAEWLKCRRSHITWLTLLVAGLLPVLHFVGMEEHPETFIPMMKRGPWDLLFMMNLDTASMAMIPVYCLLLFAFLAAIETRHHAWKQLYSLPRSYTDIYLSKFIVAQYYLVIYFLLFILFVVAEGLVLHAVIPAYPLYVQNIPWETMLVRCGRVYVGTLSLCALQYWLSMHFRNYMIPVMLGLAVLAAGPVVRLLGLAPYDPYVYPRILFAVGIPTRHFYYPTATAFIIAVCGVVLLLPGGCMLHARRGRKV